MKRDQFERLLKELDGESVQTLISKNAQYSSSDDALHNFNSGGDIFGGTAAQACWGYLTKHLVALRDMVQRNDFSDRSNFLEKCQDSINYIRFLWCIGNEKMESEQKTESNKSDRQIYRCKHCGWTFGLSERFPNSLGYAVMTHMNQAHNVYKKDGYLIEDFVNKHFEKEIM